MYLWLLRHGEALSPAGMPDAERPLSPVGRQQARRVGTFVARGPRPLAILTSPLKRAVQTSTIVASHSGSAAPETTDALLSGADHHDLIRLLNSRKEECLMVVGHEPLVSAFTALLISGHATSVLRFSPCTLALVQYSAKARANGGVLQILVPPDRLGRAVPSSTGKRS